MSPRTTRNLALGLVGSAAILALFVSCSATNNDPAQQQQNLADGQRRTTGHSYGYGGYRRPWYWGGSSYHGGSSWFGGSSSSHATSSSRPSSGSTSGSHSSAGSSSTSRGGFGGSHSSSSS